MKRMLSILLTLTMLAMPFMGVFPASMVASAVVSTTAPLVTANIDHLQTVSPSTVITITVTTQKGSTLASADTRLEGKTVATGSPVSFTPASLSLKDGVYTVVTEAKDSAGYVTIEPLTFYVDSNLNADYTLNDDGTVSTDGSLTMVQASPLSFSAGYGTTTDGNIDLSAVTSHDPSASYHLQYTDTPVEVSSASGIPYEVFNIDLQGKTSGEVAVAYTGATKKGERMALKAYNVATRKWDVLGTFVGSGNLSASLNVATYSDNGVIHVAAMLDYVTNGSNTMIWSTDPQHYTKFEDLHEYYYEIYRYAAAEYQNGNVGYIITTGDLVDDRPTASVSGKQWGVSNQAMSYVEAVGMPNGLVSGNHDVCDYKLPDYSTGENTNDYSKFWQTYPASRYNSERWYGGSINNNASHYDLITIGNVDFIVMYLGYGREATDEMIAWANQALKTYSHRTAILATHEYLDATTAKRAGRGELIYEKLVDPNPNVKMVICGHDDGALCLETTASDGRTVYEVLSDYQFVELEDPDFYANEHWIGSVPECCGDGYIRLMTVEGDTLKSVTYSPVTGRYNPRGDREVLSLDLNSGTPDRTFSTTRFSAAVLGNTTTAMNVSRVGKIVKNGITSYTTVLYQSVPSAPFDGDSTDYGNAATTPGTAYAHAAVVAPTVSQKVDVLNAVGLANDTTVSAHANYGNNTLGLKVDLTKTPYLYYSFIVPTDSEFTFAFVNDTSTAPWLTYFDNQKGGGTMSSGASNWDSNKNHEQYAVTSMTGCIDMRTLLTSSSATTWTVQQLNLYHYYGEPATLNYLFFGDAATTVAWPNTAFGPPVTTNMNTGAYVSELPPAVDHKTDVLTAVGLSDQTAVNGYKAYAGANLTVNLNKTPYLYYSFAVQPGEKFTLGFISSTTTAPWLSYIDAANNGQLNFNNDTWNAQNGAQYSATSLTGCIDMRKYVTDPTASTWKIEELRFYPSSYETAVVSYLFFGSESTNAMKDYGTANDYLALQKLLTKANALSTSGYTSASVSEFNAAKSAASSVSASSEDAVKAAYGRLEQAMGALTKTKTSISASSLVSVKNYPINTSSWKCGTTGATLTSGSSWLAATATSTGLILKRTSNATHMWPSIHYTGSGASYTVNPNGKVYLNIDVTAGNNWFIELSVTQNGKSVVVRPNVAIENGFVSTETHGHEGVFQGVYDISDAFLAVGLDPKATFNVTKTLFYVIGDDLRMTATLNHFEMMTDPASAVDYTPIYDAISDATHRTQSMYTSASWSTMQSALSAAYTAANNTSITSAALNLAAHKLRIAIDALVYVNRYEPAGSLLPDDIAQFIPTNASHINIKRQDGAIVLQNTNSQWPSATYAFSPERYVRVADHQIEVDISVGSKTNILVLIDGQSVSLSKYIGNADNAGDLPAGDYRVEIPLSSITECKGKVAVTISDAQVFSVGDAADSTVVVRRLLIEDLDDYAWNSGVTYGPAATTAGTSYAHAAKNGPTVAKKVDVLAAAGLEPHPAIDGLEAYGDSGMHLSVDLNETPYLYYSFIIPQGGRFTFAFFNKNTNVPWMVYLDAAKGGATFTSGADNWDASSATNSQYSTVSQTGCIDMRNYMTSTDSMIWQVNQVSFYSYGATGTVCYLYFGSAPIDDGYVKDKEEEEPAYTLGDVNDDGSVSTVDARMILGYVLGIDTNFTPVQMQAADFDRNGSLSTTDIRSMLQMIVNG